MNGAESLARTLVACGLDTCFANPGTSEMHFVSALDRVAGLMAAHRIAAATGARLSTPTQVARMARGRGRPPVDRVPYVVDRALAYLGGLKHMILCGSKPPVAFFAYPGKPSFTAPPDCAMHALASGEEDVIGALAALADELGAPRNPSLADVAQPETQRGPFQPEAFGLTLGVLIPENAVVCEEGATSGRALFPVTWGAGRS
jgi:acetolactate synthase-1/2/3 large subunit